jgi:hypothetical protein
MCAQLHHLQGQKPKSLCLGFGLRKFHKGSRNKQAQESSLWFDYLWLHVPSKLSRQEPEEASALFAWLISHQPAVLFSQNKSATSNQSAVLFSQNKPVPAISHQPNEQTVGFMVDPKTSTPG